ncbi:MAG: ATPase domain-containing protein, partial [Elainellaceae cyanobacterium]
YINAKPKSKMLITQMHELMQALSRRGVLTILVVGQHGVLGADVKKNIDISYLADTVLLLRYFEAAGALRRAISVCKKRYGNHERGIREIHVESGGIQISDSLHRFTGILSGLPDYSGDNRDLIGINE